MALVTFVKRQSMLAEPLINLEPLKIAPFAVGVVANMLSLIVIFAMNIIVPTFMQSILGTPALVASLTLFPAILCSCVVSPVAGRVFDKHGPGVLLPLGFACMAVFSVLTGLFIATANPIVLALIYIPVICGSALVIGPVQSFALSKLSYQLNPHGVTVMSTGFQIAGCIGSSVFTGVYTAVSAVTNAGGTSAAQAATQGVVVTGCLVGAVALVGFIVALWIRRQAALSIAPATESWEQTQVEEAARESGMSIDPSVVSLMKTDVYTLAEDALASDAMQLFASKGISGAPVVSEKGAIVGFVSDGDVMRSLANQVPAFKSAWSFIVELDNEDFNKTLSEVMSMPVSQMATRNVITVNATDDMGAVARVLVDNHLKKAPVMQDGRMVGIINRSNITAYAVSAYLGEATS